RIDGRPIDEAVDITLASASLPLGLVPNVTRAGVRYVDGGVADNVPWFPTLQFFELDELFAIMLTPYASEASAITELNLSAEGWCDHLNKLLDFELPIPPALLPDEIETLRKAIAFIRSRRGFPYAHFPVIRVLYPTRALG